METAKLMIFGDHEEDLLVDGMMASAAIPPYFPPWEVKGKRYLDGGILSKLPVRAAMERGATHVIALNVKYTYGTIESAHGMIGISSYSLSLMMEHQTIREMEWVTSAGIPVYCINLTIPPEMQFWDYAQPDRLIQRGKELTQQKLAAEPLTLRPDWRLWLQRIAARLRGRDWASKGNRES
jgi:NTE family protein